ncbi:MULTISPECIES: TetR/AcrR family transcriptional regulator [Streptomyces]|uniref:TetR family transcriptional regulator n=1 Tax=Streptomyces venezuelae TaxID=54571 RepID=A0A5P2BFV7_STRVZ|nr:MULTISPECIES: TetR/AcrR family transcriptional regulator [Streptomyces]NEA04273.1 TetR family transcriptional regulator [Streptomyces sp. SID10116]MYY83348.1 TetR family transcriptional regulator [Streptomyces sp. SID335]MYZ13161.1 TetR family transcriptional regulator [Streptomyces sp. SID337]NDZ86026.1 TetR family transcriptional regulator [Streptomyces sp. SID10115]NEB42993.1 TetR family transcriptional regulator [Streptomyces sp. SID339]
MPPATESTAPTSGLRARKKQRRFEEISETAIALFLEKGFEKVSVAEVAAAAEVSKPTLFRYFASKEDLVLHRFADHEDEAARTVAARPAGLTALDALHRHFLAGLDRHDPVTGLNDAEGVLAFHRLLYGTPSLIARLHGYQNRSEQALATALHDAHGGTPLDARLAAAQIIAVQRVLAEDNWHRVAGGEPVDAIGPEAVTAANRAFGQLRTGLARYA